MEHLIKHYPSFFDESHHQEKNFPNQPVNFHHFEVLIHKISPEFPVNITTNRINVSVGFFLPNHTKKLHIK
jgi:hypothetical protein